MLEALVVRYGLAAVFVGVALEGETVLVAAGACAHRGLLSLPLVMLVAFVASTAGDQAWFFAGRRWGRRLLARRASWGARAEALEARVERRRDLFAFGFRFLYGLRTLTPVLLGVTAYPARRFVLFNVAGAALWSVVVGGAGYLLGAALASFLRRAARVEELALLALVVTAVLVVLTRRRARG